MRILVAYASDQGHTAEIARHIRDTLKAQGHDVDLLDADEGVDEIAIELFDAVIVGASVHNWRFQEEALEFVIHHRAALDALPAAFFGVSLSAADPDPRRHRQLEESFAQFFRETGWQPAMTASFAGAIPNSRLSWVMRLFWRRLEPDRHDYTDWDAVREFAMNFITMAIGRTTAAVPR